MRWLRRKSVIAVATVGLLGIGAALGEPPTAYRTSRQRLQPQGGQLGAPLPVASPQARFPTSAIPNAATRPALRSIAAPYGACAAPAADAASPRANASYRNPVAQAPTPLTVPPSPAAPSTAQVLLPEIPPEILMQLPAGCISSWDGIQPNPFHVVADQKSAHAPPPARSQTSGNPPAADAASDILTPADDPLAPQPLPHDSELLSDNADLLNDGGASTSAAPESSIPQALQGILNFLTPGDSAVITDPSTRTAPTPLPVPADDLLADDPPSSSDLPAPKTQPNLPEQDDLLGDPADVPTPEVLPALPPSSSTPVAPPPASAPLEELDSLLLEPTPAAGPDRLDLLSPSRTTQTDDLLAPSSQDSNLLLDSLTAEDDPLGSMGPAQGGSRLMQSVPNEQPVAKGIDPHAEAFAETLYPSAASCQKCHPVHYEQWRGSAHAYSAISPMFHRFEQTLNELAKGTLGHFCIRCHAPVATQLEIPRDASPLNGPRIYREGITCVACHRVMEFTGKTSGERRIETGDIHQPIVGTSDGTGVATAAANRAQLKLKLFPGEPGPGQAMHNGMIRFETLKSSEYCMPCHQVAVHPGIALEVVWAQYRAGPACKKGVSCQDCHMGQVPGKPYGYAQGSIAYLADKPWGQPRQMSNHSFWGPGVSLAHPGLFPINDKADRWHPRDWLTFDWRAGWGDAEFENSLQQRGMVLHAPAPWQNADERRDARKIVDANLQRLAEKRANSIDVMHAALEVNGPLFDRPARVGQALEFSYAVFNRSEGHNMPTGSLGAQPQLWMNVVLIDPAGRRVWESGDLDDYGDLRDLMSKQVVSHEVPPDQQLFNLQTKFLFTNVKGTDRESPLPVPLDLDPLPFLRPGTIPVSVMNHPPFIRMEARSIPPLGSRHARYKIPGECITMPGRYRLSIRMRSRMEPPYFMRLVKAPPESVRALNEQILDLCPQSFEFDIAGY